MIPSNNNKWYEKRTKNDVCAWAKIEAELCGLRFANQSPTTTTLGRNHHHKHI